MFLFLLGDPLRVGHDLLNERITVQRLRVHHLAVHDPSLCQMLPNSNRVHIVQIVVFFLGVEVIRLDKLRDPALDLRPGKNNLISGLPLPSSKSDMQGLRNVRAVILLCQPCRRFFFPAMLVHVADNSPFGFNVWEHGAELLVYIILCQLSGQGRCRFRLCGTLFQPISFCNRNLLRKAQGRQHTVQVIQIGTLNSCHRLAVHLIDQAIVQQICRHLNGALSFLRGAEAEVNTMEIGEVRIMVKFSMRILIDGFLDLIQLRGCRLFTDFIAVSFCCGQVTVLRDQRINPLDHLAPSELYVITAGLLEFDTLAAVILGASGGVGQSV